MALLIILALGGFEMPLAADALPRATHARIAVLGLTSAPPASALPPQEAAFRHGLRELGWVEGQNLGFFAQRPKRVYSGDQIISVSSGVTKTWERQN